MKKWIDIEDELPPRDIWVNTTRKVANPEYIGTIKFDAPEYIVLQHMKDVGYTHWKLK